MILKQLDPSPSRATGLIVNNLAEFTEILEAFLAVLFSYWNVFSINNLDEIDSKSGNLRHADARIQSDCITNILPAADFQPRNPT